MRECRDSIFLTLVVASFVVFEPTLCWSAPGDNIKPTTIKEPIQDISDPALSEAAFQTKKEDQIIQFTIGTLSGNVTDSAVIENLITEGLTFNWRDGEQNFWSVSANWLNSTELAWLEVGKKFMFYSESSQEPYYKLSLSNFIDSKDSLAAFTRIDSYKASMSIGLLDLWTLGRILNCEVGLHWGVPGFAFHVQAGAQWSF